MRKRMWISMVLLGWLVRLATVAGGAEELEKSFVTPPAETRPWVYWYWMNDKISRDGLTRDLEAMSRVGIGAAFIGNIGLDPEALGAVPVLSEQWWQLVEHAIREGGRLGVDIGMFNCPGWSMSGGPWIKPDESMRYLVCSETHLEGPMMFNGQLPMPKQAFQDVSELDRPTGRMRAATTNMPFQDVAVLAFPVPDGDADAISVHNPRITCTPECGLAALMADGNLNTVGYFGTGAAQQKACVVDLQVDEPFTARTLVLHPAPKAFSAKVELKAADDAGVLKTVRTFTFDRSNPSRNVGPMRFGPVVVAFEPATARHFQVVFSNLQGAGGFAEIELSGAARLESYVEKQLGKMHQTPQPMWDAYLWPEQAEPERGLTVVPDDVRDISGRMGADGRLRWEVPAGEWVVLRIGMTPTGVKNSPTSPQGQGPEVDKMSRSGVRKHFDAYIGQLLSRMPKEERRALRYVVADSYEMGSENWTDDFGQEFRQRYGYNPRPWLAVLTGRIVGSVDQSNRFLWDMRRLVADRVARDYVGGLRDECRAHGLKQWLENYGHWGYPAEFLQYGGATELIAGEFWATGVLGSIELRAASSAAHIYGKPVVSAEAFTGGPPFRNAPSDLKARGDWAFCQGINHFVLHLYIHQPWEHRRPGINAPFGTEFNRHNTWFGHSRAWIDYLRRCHLLLQQGVDVADVCYFIGEDTPKMTGVCDPKLPAGYNFDYINADVIHHQLRVSDGRFVLPSGASYRLMVLPKLETMRPELLGKICELVLAGGAVLGPAPRRSPSMQNYPACDAEVRQLAAELWGSAPTGSGISGRHVGKGWVFSGDDLEKALRRLNVTPDFICDNEDVLWTHRGRGDFDVYFLSNQQDNAVDLKASFRVSGRAPELWYADSGRVEKTAWFESGADRTVVPLSLEPYGSVFVMFREPVREEPIVKIMKDGRPLEAPGVAGRVDWVRLKRGESGELELLAGQGGEYTFVEADGDRQSVKLGELPSAVRLSGPWSLSFPAESGAPGHVKPAELKSWTQYSDKTVQYFSGTGTYRKAFKITADMLKAGRRLMLDLGAVEDLAEVWLNGKDLGVLWKRPFVVDITDAARIGANRLEVKVTNVWWNRLVGKAKYPQGIPTSGQGEKANEEGYEVYVTHQAIGADAELLPSGLLGPVVVQAVTDWAAEK